MTAPWSSIFLRFFFPGNLSPAVKRWKPSPEIKILAREDASQVGIEYVNIHICDSRSVVLVSHGRMRTLDQQSVTQWRDWGQANGISVLLHNYPGYGKTPGPVTTARILADLELLVKFLERGCTWREEQISLLGNSLGCGPTIYLAARKQYRFNKVVLISPYTSCFAWGGWGLSLLEHSCFDPFDSTLLMQRLQERQVFMVCGDKDSTISPLNSKELFRLLGDHNSNHAQNRLCTVPGEDHKYTRLKVMSAVAHFLNDDHNNLKEELERLEQGGTEVASNSYAD